MPDPSLGALGTDQPLAILNYTPSDPEPSFGGVYFTNGYLHRELRGVSRVFINAQRLNSEFLLDDCSIVLRQTARYH